MARVTVTAPDGATGVMEFPDDWSRERVAQEVDSALKLRAQGSVSMPTSARNAAAMRQETPISVEDRYSQRYNPEQPLLPYVLNQGAKAVTGLAGMAELGARILGNPIEAAKTFREGGLLANKAAKAIGIDPNMKAPSPASEALTDIGVNVGTNFLFPGGTFGQKVASGIGSSLGMQATKDAGTGAEITAAIVGGTIAPMMFAGRVRAIGDAYKYITKPIDEYIEIAKKNPDVMNSIRTQVINDLTSAMRADPARYKAMYDEAQKLEQALGVKFNLGQSFMAPSVMQKQHQLGASSALEMNRAEALMRENQAKLRGVLGSDELAGERAQGTLDLLAQQGRNAVTTLQRGSASALDDARSASTVLPNRFDPEASGQSALNIRRGLKTQAMKDAEGKMNDAVKAAIEEKAVYDARGIIDRTTAILKQPIWDDANVTAVHGKIAEFGRKAEQKAAEQAGPSILNPATGKPFDSIAPPKNFAELPFEDLADLRKAVNKDIAAAMQSRSPNAREQLRNLGLIKDEIDTAISSAPFEKTKAKFGEFVDFYRETVAPKFLRGQNALADKTQMMGNPALPPEKVFETYLKPMGGLPMRRYVELYGDNPQAMRLMEDAVRDRYTKEVIKDGLIDPKAHDRFIRNYGLPLKIMEGRGSGVAAELQDAQKATAMAVEKSTRLAETADQIANSNFTKLISDKYGSKTPYQVMEVAMRDPRAMRELVTNVGKEDAKAIVGFMKDDFARKVVADNVVASKEIGALLNDPQRLQAYKIALASAYSPKDVDGHIETLKMVEKAAQRLEAVPPPTAAQVSENARLYQDAIKSKLGLSIASLGNMVRAVLMGRSSAFYLGTAAGTQALATVMQNIKAQVYGDIIKDPEAAKLLLKAMTEAPQSAAGMDAMKKYIKKVPQVVGYFMGVDKAPAMAGMTAVNIGREQASRDREAPQ